MSGLTKKPSGSTIKNWLKNRDMYIDLDFIIFCVLGFLTFYGIFKTKRWVINQIWLYKRGRKIREYEEHEYDFLSTYWYVHLVIYAIYFGALYLALSFFLVD